MQTKRGKGGACIYTESHQYSDWGGVLELVSLHSTSMSIIGSMVYFGHPVLLRTSGISHRILPERTVRRLGIKCRVVNKSWTEATLTKYHHRDVYHSGEYCISSWVVSTQFSMKTIETNHITCKSIKHRLPYFITHKLINLNWFSIYQLLLLYSTRLQPAGTYCMTAARIGNRRNLFLRSSLEFLVQNRYIMRTDVSSTFSFFGDVTHAVIQNIRYRIQ